LPRSQTPQASVVVDLTPMKPIVAPRSTASYPVQRGGGMWVVVLVYVIAAAALALSIYTRFF
jgi:hypothetical protein